MYVIAHELAHVVLRHSEISNLAQILLYLDPPIYTRDDMKALDEWHEDCADLQVWRWGFKDELKEFLDAFPEARRPRWYVEIERKEKLPADEARYRVECQYHDSTTWDAATFHVNDLAKARQLAALLQQALTMVQAIRVVDQETGEVVGEEES